MPDKCRDCPYRLGKWCSLQEFEDIGCAKGGTDEDV